jgi:putative FmdB family regulatory protein
MLLKQDENMPIYEYACKSCRETFEFVQKMSDCALTKHPSCQGGSCELEKIPSRFFGQIKGGERPQTTQEPQNLPATKEPIEKSSHVCAKYCDLHG